jgi:hypothetical protein
MSCPEELNVFFGPDDDTPTPGARSPAGQGNWHRGPGEYSS